MQLLLVVDDWEALEVYENFLAPHFEVHPAPFGSEGVRMAVAQRPDRIFIDLTLEDMTPVEAIEALRSRDETREIPLTVVFNQGTPPYECPGVFPRTADQILQRPYDLAAWIDAALR